MRYLLLVEYDGTHFSGYQRQKGLRTVQGELEQAAEQIAGVPTHVVASGRTDAGVHAAGQVCQLDCEITVPAHKLRECFNALLPADVKVLASAAATEGFDCTRGAKRKTYVYSAYYAETEQPLLGRYAARLKNRPDSERMREAAALLLGEHDFAAFRASGYTSKTSVRTIYDIQIDVQTENGHTMYRVSVTGNGFLYNMVRILVGELVSIGLGKGTNALREALETGNRALLARTMPACGLMMKEVDYGVPLFGSR